MTHRIGECSACGAVFKLPASFAHDQARCTKCGGVVNIAPAGAAAPPPVPAKKVVQRPAPVAAVAPAPAPAPAPKKERTGPSMKEQILARQQAAAAEPRAAAAHAAAPTATRPASARPTVKAAAPTPARAATKPAAAHAPSRASSSSARPERASAGEKSEKGRSAARSGSRHRGSEPREVPYRERVQAQHKKSTLIFGGVAMVLVAALSVGVWLAIYGKKEPAAAGDSAQLASTAGATTDGAGASPADSGAGADAAATPPEAAGAIPPAGDPATPAPAEGTAGDALPGTPPDTADTPADEPAKPAATEKSPDLVDLAVIADFERLPETSDEQWDEIRQAVADAFDLDAGASSGRARTKLEQIGKPAFPAILNAMKRIDVTTETGHRVGDLMQKTLERICNGNNFGWKYPGEKEQFYFNKRVIETWCKQWDIARTDEAKWAKLSKQGANQEKPEEDPGADETGLDADDFDIDD